MISHFLLELHSETSSEGKMIGIFSRLPRRELCEAK